MTKKLYGLIADLGDGSNRLEHKWFLLNKIFLLFNVFIEDINNR